MWQTVLLLVDVIRFVWGIGTNAILQALIESWFHQFTKIYKIYISLQKYSTVWKMSVFGVFLVRVFLHSDWIWRGTESLFLFNQNAGKYGPENLQIRTLFTQCRLVPNSLTYLHLSMFFLGKLTVCHQICI